MGEDYGGGRGKGWGEKKEREGGGGDWRNLARPSSRIIIFD